MEMKRFTRNRIAGLAILASFLVASLASATVFLPPVKMPISYSEKKKIGLAACTSPFGERPLRVVGMGHGGKPDYAKAVCTGDRKLGGKRVLREAICSRLDENREWNCSGAQYIEVTIGRDLVRVVGDPDILLDALGATRYLMEEEIFSPYSSDDETTVPSTEYLRVTVSLAEGGIIKIEKFGGWHLVRVIRSPAGDSYLYLGPLPY